jgi:uncharacterized protein (DUF58 family)
MWFRNILRPRRPDAPAPLFDEQFLRRLERLSLEAQRRLRGRPSGGEHVSRHRRPATILSDHRPYTPGDDFRSVDWKTYAAHNELFVKLGEVEQSIPVHLLLDVSRSMTWGQPPKLRAAQQLAAALGYLVLSHHDLLHVAPFGSTPLPAFGPAQGKGHLVTLLRYLERIQPARQTALAQALTAYGRRFPRGGLAVICSDLLVHEGLEQGLRALPPPRWQVLVLHLLDQRELQPEVAGPVELEDLESGQRLALTLDAETVAAYARGVAAWQDHVAGLCAGAGAGYAQLMTDWPLERAVVPYLRQRGIVR